MQNRYLIIRNGAKKATGEAYSVGVRIGRDKLGHEFIFEKDTYFTDKIKSVGTIVIVEQMEV